VVAKLNAEINAIMKEPEAQQKLKTIGFDVMIKPEAEAATTSSARWRAGAR
jgi:Trk K+ transport system NAD-binding subunit